MRTATILALALAATIAATAAPAQNVAFTKPLWDWPSGLEKFEQTWRDLPAFTQPLLQRETAPEPVIPSNPEVPEETYLHRGPTSEEWHCLVPLQQTAPPPVSGPAPNRCQTPSLEPDQLFHLL